MHRGIFRVLSALAFAGFITCSLSPYNSIEGEIGSRCLRPPSLPCRPPHSECVEDVCLCMNLYRWINGECVNPNESSTLGRPCRSGGACGGPGEFCSSFGICMCLSTHIDIENQCKPAVYPGQAGCEDSRQCSKGFPGASCEDRRCQCPHGMKASHQTCVIPSVLANTILSDDQFQRQLYQREGRYGSGNFFKRRYSPSAPSSGLAPETICSVDSDCSGYPLSFCDGVCKCVQGALNAGSTCITSSNALQPAGSCPPGQTYVTEVGACMTVQQAGEPCQYSQQCAAVEPGAFCLRLRCECVYGMKQSGGGCTFTNTQCTKRGFIWISELGECKEVLPPGGRGCSHNLQCTEAYPEASCFLQTCTCPINFPIAIDGTCGRNCTQGETYSGVTGQCLPTVQAGDQCLYSSQCHALHPGMICDRNRCRCPNGLVFSGSKCVQTCPTGYIVNSRGVCMPGCRMSQIEFEGECLDQMTPGGSCVVNAQCTGGASCQNAVCTCPKAMIPRGSVCVSAESSPSESCVNGEVCIGGSFCVNGNCTCPVGKQVLNGQCLTPLTAAPIGESCVRVGVVCAGGSICVVGVCVCPLGTTPYKNVCIDRKSASPGELCTRGEECTGNSECDKTTGKCECSSKTQMVIGKECHERLRSHPGYPCANGELCVGASICLDGRCACPQNMIEVNKQCIQRVTVGAGMSCSSGEVCSGGSTCDQISKKCSCPRGQQIVNQECVLVPIVKPGDSCLGLVRCGGGAYCVRGRCECPHNMVPRGERCQAQRQVLPGDRCTPGDICTGRSVCRNGSCECLRDMILRERRCETRRKAMPLEPCRVGDECMGGSKCNGLICECPSGEVRRENSCQPRITKRPGLFCSSDDLCVGHSVCIKGICQCKPGERIINSQCVKSKQVIPGGECSDRDACLGGAVCRGGVCICPVGHAIVAQTCKLVIKVRLGSSCANGQLCEGGGLCDSKRKICVCPAGEVNRRGKCYSISRRVLPTAEPGESCSEGERCRGGSECSQGICVCAPGLSISQKKCLPSVRAQSLAHEELTPCPEDGSCRLPDCFCSRSGEEAPAGLKRSEVPQMVVLSFDDPVTDRTINIYKSLFSGRFRNPNGCAIKGSFFVSHQWNNYDQTQWLFAAGHEIGVNSITHESLNNQTKERWRFEMGGLRDSLQAFSYVDRESVRGIRAPHLLIGGDNQFEMMAENDFEYDNSMPVREGPVWPQTLDHRLAWDCGEQNCPKKPFKGIWELPLQLLVSNDGIWHNFARTAIKPYDSVDSVKKMLLRNFYRNYNGNRAPFVLNADSDFLTYLPDNGVVHAIEQWLKQILNGTDVYVVTGSQVIDWMKKPTKLDNIKRFKRWQCDFRMNDHVQPCEMPSICSYDSRSPQGMPHSFRVCGSCPKAYPWIEDPLGRKQLRK